MLVATWNSQGYKFGDGQIRRLLNDNHIDVLCLQECGILSNISFERRDRDENVYEGRWEEYIVIYYPWRGGKRCNMAIMVKECINIEQAGCLVPLLPQNFIPDGEEEKTEEDESPENHERKGLRGMLHVQLALQDGRKFRIANVHLPSGRPAFARKIGHFFLSMPFMYSGNVVLLGDFNTFPDSWGNLTHHRIESSGYSTHPETGTELDYMITTIGAGITSELGEVGQSDHLPVIFKIE